MPWNALLVVLLALHTASAFEDIDEHTATDSREVRELAARPTRLGNFANVRQVYYCTVKLHELDEAQGNGVQSMTMFPKLTRDASVLQALEPHLGRSRHNAVLHSVELEEGEASGREVRGAAAEADAADAWADMLHGRDKSVEALHPPRILFNTSGRIVQQMIVMSDNDHLQPFTVMMANSETGDVILNVTSFRHSMGAGAVAIPLQFFQCATPCDDRFVEFEVVVVFHPRRLTTFDVTLRLSELDEGSLRRFAPWNESFGMAFVALWANRTLGLWATRRAPIPDMALEIRTAIAGHVNQTDGLNFSRLVASVFDNVPPGGIGFSDALQHTDAIASVDPTLVHLHVIARFAERPRTHYARFAVTDFYALVARARRRAQGDGEVVMPTAVDRRSADATAVFPVQLRVRIPKGSDYMTVEVLQPRPMEHVQVRVCDGSGDTVFVEEERHIDHVEHWRRDVPHFGWHHVIPVNKPIANNTVVIDVLFDNATTTSTAGQMLEWAADHGAELSAIGIDQLRVGYALDHAAGALGGEVLRARTAFKRGDVLAVLPHDLLLFSSKANTLHWIVELFASRSFRAFCNADGEDPVVSEFFGPLASDAVRVENLELLKLTLMVMAAADPVAAAGVRFLRFYRSFASLVVRSTWQTPLQLANASAPFIATALPHFSERGIVAADRAWQAMHQFLTNRLSWLFRDAVRHGWRSKATRLGFPDEGEVGWPYDDFVHVVIAVRQLAFRMHHSSAAVGSWGEYPVLVPVASHAVIGIPPNAAASLVGTEAFHEFTLVATRDIAIDDVIALPPRIDAMTTLEALSVYGMVPIDAVDAVDMPGGTVLRADRKRSRDAVIRSAHVCAAPPSYLYTAAEQLYCLARFREVLDARLRALPAMIERPEPNSPLYDRSIRLMVATTRCIAAARRAIRSHQNWASDDLADLERVVPPADRVDAFTPPMPGPQLRDLEDEDF